MSLSLTHSRIPRSALNRLTEQIQALESARSRSTSVSVSTGWLAPHHHFSLERGVVHELFYSQRSCSKHSSWTPPLLVMLHLVRQVLTQVPGERGLVVWIGRRMWPSISALTQRSGIAGEPALLGHSLFVEAEDVARRTWAIDVALRSSAACSVVADGSGIDLAQSRRLQLAAQSGESLVLLARHPAEQHELSCASTRWLVTPRRSSIGSPQWSLSCLRSKGLQRFPAPDAQPPLILEWNRATCCIGVAAGMVERSGETSLGTMDVPERRAAGSA
jgi:hypothetical protein